MNNNAPEPLPEIQKVVDAAKNERTVELDQNEFAVVLDQNEAVRERAKAVLESREEWQALKATIEAEKGEDENKETLEDQGIRDGLDALERQIDDSIRVAPGGDVVIESPAAATEPKTLVDKVKNMFGGVGSSMLGMIVRGWIGIQRQLVSLGIVQGSPQQLDAIEKMYGKWFGASEAIDKGNATLLPAGIEVVKDKKDAQAYYELKKEYLQKLTTKTDGKSPELQAMEREQYTFDAYLDEKLSQYAKDHADGKKSRTTLTGILRNQRPAEAAETERS